MRDPDPEAIIIFALFLVIFSIIGATEGYKAYQNNQCKLVVMEQHMTAGDIIKLCGK